MNQLSMALVPAWLFNCQVRDKDNVQLAVMVIVMWTLWSPDPY